MKTISIPAYNRPKYLKTALDSLKQCGDWSDYELFVSLEHGSSEEVVNMCKAIDWIKTHINLAPVKLGCDKNTLRSLSLAFEAGSDFSIYWEDDIEASPSLKRLADWYYDLNDQEFGGLFFETYFDPPTPPNEVFNIKSFNPHGFCIRRWQFEQYYKPNWLNYDLDRNQPRGWDWNMNAYLSRINPTIQVLFPKQAHSHHIGLIGTYCYEEIYRQQGQHLLTLAGEITEPYYLRRV